jgi:ADP-heptose:LPS heptosyltransferase
VSIQRELRGEDAELLARTPRLTHIGDALEDFEDTAAVAALVDVVVSVDTSVVHLAGAMGRPTWILLPFCPDWRWMLDREDSPWYPTARLFRQPTLGDWDSVVGRVRDALVNFS